jgi:hypothetical protein
LATSGLAGSNITFSVVLAICGTAWRTDGGNWFVSRLEDQFCANTRGRKLHQSEKVFNAAAVFLMQRQQQCEAAL